MSRTRRRPIAIRAGAMSDAELRKVLPPGSIICRGRAGPDDDNPLLYVPDAHGHLQPTSLNELRQHRDDWSPRRRGDGKRIKRTIVALFTDAILATLNGYAKQAAFLWTLLCGMNHAYYQQTEWTYFEEAGMRDVARWARGEYPELHGLPATICQDVARNVVRAFKAFVKDGSRDRGLLVQRQKYPFRFPRAEFVYTIVEDDSPFPRKWRKTEMAIDVKQLGRVKIATPPASSKRRYGWFLRDTPLHIVSVSHIRYDDRDKLWKMQLRLDKLKKWPEPNDTDTDTDTDTDDHDDDVDVLEHLIEFYFKSNQKWQTGKSILAYLAQHNVLYHGKPVNEKTLKLIIAPLKDKRPPRLNGQRLRGYRLTDICDTKLYWYEYGTDAPRPSELSEEERMEWIERY